MTNKEQTIANLKKLKSVHNGSYGADIDRAIKALERVSWIPVSERLPEVDDFYLVTIQWESAFNGKVYTVIDMASYIERMKE